MHDCRPYRAGRPHMFSPVSGWCVHGCGVRDDGRVVNVLTGSVIAPGPHGVDYAPRTEYDDAAPFDFAEPRRGADR